MIDQHEESTKGKRGYKRYVARGRAMAVIPPNSIMPYPIINISENGLAFRYTGHEDWPSTFIELDIFNDHGFYLNKLPSVIIADCSMGDESSRIRRCCVQFSDLTPEKKSQLAYFIEKHTIGVE